MSIVFRKIDQGITYTVGGGSPVHSGSIGERYIDSASGTYYVYSGSSWVNIIAPTSASFSTTASYSETASYFAGTVATASYAVTASYVLNAVSASYAPGLTYFTEAQNTSSPNASVHVNSLTAVSSTSSADIAIVPKGSGSIIADIPDGTTAGGNKRGLYVVDLQHGPRANADRVASSDYSTIIGGRDNRAYNTYTIAGGYAAFAGGNQSTALQQGSTTNVLAFAHGSRSTASGYGAVVFGSYVYGDTIASGDNSTAINGSNQATAHFSIAYGGYYNIASGYGSYASGFATNTFGITGRNTYGYTVGNLDGSGTVSGNCQKSIFPLGIRTTDNTATTLTVGGRPASATNQVILSNQSAYRFKGTIIGKKSGTTDTAAWDIDGHIVRGANAASTTLVVGNVNLVSNTSGWGTPTLAADTTNGGLQVQVTGVAATNIQWSCIIETTEVLYA